MASKEGVPILTASDSVTITSIVDANLSVVYRQGDSAQSATGTADPTQEITLYGRCQHGVSKQISLNGHNLSDGCTPCAYTHRIQWETANMKKSSSFFVETAQTEPRKIRLYDPEQTEQGQNILIQSRIKTFGYQALKGMTLPANATAELFVDNQQVPGHRTRRDGADHCRRCSARAKTARSSMEMYRASIWNWLHRTAHADRLGAHLCRGGGFAAGGGEL